ncbi:hypothetical protein ACTXT7_006234 [Hymenolepis weldensis]
MNAHDKYPNSYEIPNVHLMAIFWEPFINKYKQSAKSTPKLFGPVQHFPWNHAISLSLVVIRSYFENRREY